MNQARRTALARLVVGAAVAVALVLVVGAAQRIASGRYGDFTHFYLAAQAVREGAAPHDSGEGGYIYPPLLAFVFQPFTALSLKGAASAWLAINAVLLGLGVLVAAREGMRRFALPAFPWACAVLASIGFLLTVDKTRATLNQAQTDCLLILGFALGLRWLERRPMLAGLALGFAANIKYLSLIALPYMILRRRWAAAAWTAGSTVVWALLPAASLGWRGNLDALRRAGAGLLGAVGFALPGEGANIHAAEWDLSVSVTSAISRLFDSGDSAAVKFAMIGAAGLIVLAMVWAIYRARGRPLLWCGDRDVDPGAAATTALEWSGLVVASLAFGPQTTGRHLVLMLAVHPIVVAILMATRAGPVRLPLVAGVVAFQLAMVLPPGGRAFEPAVDAWRAVGGASWCLLGMYLAMVWAGLPRADAHPMKPAGTFGIERPGPVSGDSA